MVKLIVIDIDGTLLDKKKNIPPENVKAVRHATDKGVAVALNSGRPFQSIRQYALQLGLHGPIISSNGAQVRELATGRILCENPISRERCAMVVEVAREVGCGCTLYSGDGIVAEKEDEVIKFYTIDNGKLPKELQYQVEVVDDLLCDRVMSLPLLKVEISGLSEDNALSFHKRMEEIGGLALVDCYGGGMEITDCTADKAQGTARLAGLYGIDRSEVMALGDSPNDTAMLEYAGIPYVMGNAKESIRCRFPNVTDTNVNAGVAKAIFKEIV